MTPKQRREYKLQNACMERGEGYEDVLASNKESVRQLFAAAEELSKEFKIPFELALARLEQKKNSSHYAAVKDRVRRWIFRVGRASVLPRWWYRQLEELKKAGID